MSPSDEFHLAMVQYDLANIEKAMIISLSADLPQAGKDTLYKGVAAAFKGRSVHRLAFGDALKDALVSEMYPRSITQQKNLRSDLETHKDIDSIEISELTISHFKWWLCEQGLDVYAKRSPRWYLWQFGTNYMRKHLKNDTRWLNIVLEQIRLIIKSNPSAIIFITDTRFPIEHKALTDIGAKTVMIHPQGFPSDWYDPATLEAFLASPIETALRNHKFDLHLINKYDHANLTTREMVEFINSHS